MIRNWHETLTRLYECPSFGSKVSTSVHTRTHRQSLQLSRGCGNIWLTLILLTWRIGWAPNNDSRWKMGYNSAFKGSRDCSKIESVRATKLQIQGKSLMFLKCRFNSLNAELNPIFHLLALLGAHYIFHVSGLRVKHRNTTMRCDISDVLTFKNRTSHI